MNTRASAFCVLALVYSVDVAAVTVHFNSDFSSAIDTGSSIVDSSGTLTQPMGDLTLSSFGSMDGTALVFNPNSNSYEQARLSLGAGASGYHIEFDIQTSGLVGSDYAFTMLADTPTVQTLSFSNCCSDTIRLGSSNFGTVVDNALMHVSIDIDLANELWTADISGVGSTTSAFSSSGGDIEALRFSLAPALGGAGLDSSVYVAIDNLYVTSIPVPAALWLFLSGGMGLVTLIRRRK